MTVDHCFGDGYKLIMMMMMMLMTNVDSDDAVVLACRVVFVFSLEDANVKIFRF